MRTALYAQAKDLMTPEEFDARVRDKVAEWGHLIDDEAAARLVLDEVGRGTVNFQELGGLREGMEVTLRARVDGIGSVREFARRDGSIGRVVNLDISDPTGRCRVALWDDDVSLVAQGRIRPGSAVRLVDCYVKVTRFGTEISRGKFGSVLPDD